MAAVAAPAIVEPPALLCPITWQLFREPVINCIGNSYERAAIVAAWAAQRCKRKRDPLTNTRLANTTLVPNHALRRQARADSARAGGFASRARRHLIDAAAPCAGA